MLDFSTTFDTIDQNQLLDIMDAEFAVKPKALSALTYLKNRPNWHYNIRAGTFTLWSASGIGAWSCDVYVADNTSTTYFQTSWYQVGYHKYADDLQLFIIFDLNIPGDRENFSCADEIMCSRDQAVDDIYRWLKLNDEKTEMTIFTFN